MRTRAVWAVFLAALWAAVSVSYAAAQWPTTCVELNDIVEAHLGNDSNVGIYQRVFGDQAEQACQNDHRDDVRSVFAWAIGGGGEAVIGHIRVKRRARHKPRQPGTRAHPGMFSATRSRFAT